MRNYILLLIIITLTASCKEKLEYKYSDKPDILPCSLNDGMLIKEALYSFENYIVANYPYRDLHNINLGYSNYWHTATSDTPPKTDSLNAHTKSILNSLLARKNLWITTNGKITLNPDSELITCIAKNIADKDLKTTFNALISAKTLRSEYFMPAINRRSELFVKDKALATYVALELFYGKLAKLDLTISDQERIEKNKSNSTHDNHDGHNH